ncbi:MAG: MBL fold metallo-hydrolase [Kiritimatiellia bacterium]|nr:MBL fold metallo-hydrolase [Kiritimatiellia bacterium]
MNLAETIKKTEVLPGSVAFFFLGQAGFCFNFSNGKTLFLDAYLSDSCYRLFGFKRMTPTVIRPEEVSADIFFSTHSHADHLDPDALEIIAKNRGIYFLGSPDCAEIYRQAGIAESRYGILKYGQEKEICGLKLKAVYADHGDLAPEAIGLLIDYDGIKIYNTGDTAYAPDKIIPSLASEVDVMIAPINGAFGNINAAEACRLAELIRPRILIPAHFWMFVEHNGDPAEFLKEAEKLPAGIKPLIMAPGEKLVYRGKSLASHRAAEGCGL